MLLQELENNLRHANNKVTIAKVIASMLGVEDAESMSPETAVNMGLLKVKKQRLTPAFIDVLKKMIQTATDAGIKINVKFNFPETVGEDTNPPKKRGRPTLFSRLRSPSNRKGGKPKEPVPTKTVKSKQPTTSPMGRPEGSQNEPGEDHIIMQLRSAQDLDGNKVIKFRHGGDQKVDIKHINKILKIHDRLEGPRPKRILRVLISKSHDDLKNMANQVKEQLEEDTDDHVSFISRQGDHERSVKKHYESAGNQSLSPSVRNAHLKAAELHHKAAAHNRFAALRAKSNNISDNDVAQAKFHSNAAKMASSQINEAVEDDSKDKPTNKKTLDTSADFKVSKSGKKYPAHHIVFNKNITEDEEEGDDYYDFSDKDLDDFAKEIDHEDDIIDLYDPKEIVIVDTETGEVIEHDEDLNEDTINRLDEVMTRMERIRSRIRFIRTKSKRQRKLQIALKRHSSTAVLNQRARRQAIKTLKEKMIRKPVSQMTLAEKERAEAMIAKRKPLINRLALRMVPRIRNIENARLSHPAVTQTSH